MVSQIRRAVALVLPALIPSWRFFRAVAASPRVELRQIGGDWQEAAPRPAHVPLWVMLRRLVWNPAWNRDLYLASLAERVVEQGSHRALAELQARLGRGRAGQRLQLRLVFIDREGDALSREVLYESAPFDGRGD